MNDGAGAGHLSSRRKKQWKPIVFDWVIMLTRFLLCSPFQNGMTVYLRRLGRKRTTVVAEVEKSNVSGYCGQWPQRRQIDATSAEDELR